jgi:hypothetical protein
LLVVQVAGSLGRLERRNKLNMALAAILGVCVLLPWSQARVALSVRAMAVWQSTQSHENQASNSSSQSSSAQPSTDQQKAPDQSAAPPQPPAAAGPPCAGNSQPGSSTKSDCKPAESSGTKTKKRHRTQKTVSPAATPADTGHTKTVVRNGSTADPTVDLSPGPSPRASQLSESTKQLLASSDANLKKISGRQLNESQQDTVRQVESYMEQANTAAKDGDVQRAYNLAVKANLLSAELSKH